MKSSNALLVGLILLTIQSFAQSFQWTASVAPIQKSGFYVLPLSPQTLAASALGLADIRLYNTAGIEIPYLIKKDQYSFDKSFFVDYPLANKEIEKGCCTKLIVHNEGLKNWNNFCVIVKNHDVSKTATLSGSDDKTNWFALKENVQFDPLNNVDQTFGTCYVSFPLSNYRYFSLTINDSTSPPLNILQVGYYNSEVSFGKFRETPSPKISQADSLKLKRTFVRLMFNAAYPIDKMHIEFEGTKFFSRNATLYAIDRNEKGKKEQTFLQSFQLNSAQANDLSLDNEQHTEYIIEIENGDNPLLHLKKIDAFQLNTYLIAYLETGTNYQFRTGNKDLQTPQYDISQFSDSIHGDLPVLALGTLMKKQEVKAIEKQQGFFLTNWWIWAAIALVIGLLILMSVKMLKEMGKDNLEK